MKGAIFVTVRSKSSRLPNKAILEIKSKPTIQHVIERAKRSTLADIVVVCTTDQPEDDQICKLAELCGVAIFRGSERDKLARWLGAARQYKVDYFVTADGDDLFCEPALNDLALTQFKNGHADFIHSSRLIPGAFTYAIRTSALEKVCQIKDTDETEMMWVYFVQTGLFKVEELSGDLAPYIRDGVRITLDYQEDFHFFREVFDALYEIDSSMPLKDILLYIDSHPEISKINSAFNEVWSANQAKNTNLLLKPQYLHLVKPIGDRS
jgi:spore coat polysaccharide biosynthesis protein SpsF (cytidylyltransferase family)